MSELIKKQFAVTRKTLSELLDGVSNQVTSTIPNGFNNNIHWQVGHMLTIAEAFVFNGNEQLPSHYQELFGYGSKPENWKGDVPTVETLLGQLKEQLVRIKETSQEHFDKDLPEPILGNQKVGELTAMAAYHEAMHLGQVQTLKRLIEANK